MKCLQDILNSKISRIAYGAFGVKTRMGKEAKIPKAIIDGDNNDVLSTELYAVKEGIETRVKTETTAVHPYHHWQTT